MKKDELLDLMSEFKVDDAFVDEALGEQDGAPVRVYAGSSKRSPMRIAAPIAACLAVVAAAGLLVVNVSRGKLATGPAASIEESSEVGETSEEESTPPDNTEIIPTGDILFPSRYPNIIEECKDIIKSKFAQVSQDDTIWQASDMDIDQNGSGELLLCPLVNGRSVKGVGVCVFQINSGDAAYIGSFGSEFSSMNLDEFYFGYSTNAELIYYFNNDEENEKCVDSIQELTLDKSTGTIQDKNYLRLVKTYPNDASSDTPYTETAYRYGAEISTEQLLSEWKAVGYDDNFVIVPTMNGFDAHCNGSEYVQFLAEKYNVPLIGASPNSLHRNVKSLDINGDGEDEAVIQFKNCEQLRGIYVFSADGKLIGEFNLVGDRGESWNFGTINMDTPVEIQKFENGNESYYYFRTVQTETRILNPGSSSVAKWLVNKIVVNEDGTLSSEVIAEWGAEFVSDEGYETREICRVNGEDVSSSDAHGEISKHHYPEFPFVW